MVTGGSGSIGKEICRSILQCDPGSVLALDWDEQGVYELEAAFSGESKGQFEVMLANIGSRQRVDRILREHRPDIVFHMAAYKHVRYIERFPEEGVINNVFGTRTVAELAVEHNVGRFVFVSTDKAVDPVSVYGATKALCEHQVTDLSRVASTTFITVRFGNVLASRGSVIPRLDAQVQSGGPVTVSHPEAERYFMTVREAARLVLQSNAVGQNGDLCIRVMGDPIRILDLAMRLIALRGRTDVGIEITALGPGDKICEALLTEDESQRARQEDGMFICPVDKTGPQINVVRLGALEAAAVAGNSDAIREHLAALVPTFRPQTNGSIK